MPSIPNQNVFYDASRKSSFEIECYRQVKMITALVKGSTLSNSETTMEECAFLCMEKCIVHVFKEFMLS
jgi:hypothetical protein